MNMTVTSQSAKEDVFQQVQDYLTENGFSIENSDSSRPWGGFFVIQENQAPQFIDFFLKDIPEAKMQMAKISPKILIVAPNKRLSWQYHHRRAEVWKVIHGTVQVVTSDTDQEENTHTKQKDDVIILKQGERHRLIGLDNWGIVAEIWQHTNADHPSNEDDIVRVQDDFGR